MKKITFVGWTNDKPVEKSIERDCIHIWAPRLCHAKQSNECSAAGRCLRLWRDGTYWQAKALAKLEGKSIEWAELLPPSERNRRMFKYERRAFRECRPYQTTVEDYKG